MPWSAPGPATARTLVSSEALARVDVDQHRLERPAVAAIDEIHRLAAARGRAIAVAPLLQTDDHGEQRGALVGQAVFVAQRTLAVGGLAEDAGLDKFLQPCRQNIAGDARFSRKSSKRRTP